MFLQLDEMKMSETGEESCSGSMPPTLSEGFFFFFFFFFFSLSYISIPCYVQLY
jgi:hypothetical protein